MTRSLTGRFTRKPYRTILHGCYNRPFPHSRLRSVAQLTMSVVLTLVFLALAVAGITDLRANFTFLVVVAIFIACAALVGAVTVEALTALVRQPRRGALVLRQDGIWHRGPTWEQFTAWEDTYDVVAAIDNPGRRHNAATPYIEVRVHPLAPSTVRWLGWRPHKLQERLLPSMAIPVLPFIADPSLVLTALSFYQANPQCRSELATSAALERWR